MEKSRRTSSDVRRLLRPSDKVFGKVIFGAGVGKFVQPEDLAVAVLSIEIRRLEAEGVEKDALCAVVSGSILRGLQETASDALSAQAVFYPQKIDQQPVAEELAGDSGAPDACVVVIENAERLLIHWLKVGDIVGNQIFPQLFQVRACDVVCDVQLHDAFLQITVCSRETAAQDTASAQSPRQLPGSQPHFTACLLRSPRRARRAGTRGFPEAPGRCPDGPRACQPSCRAGIQGAKMPCAAASFPA